MSDPRAVSLRWHKIYRVVNAKHPPVNVFEDIVSARQLDMAWHIEGLTNYMEIGRASCRERV